jgi:uncharacterized repeat protein (TIGR03803 family)
MPHKSVETKTLIMAAIVASSVFLKPQGAVAASLATNYVFAGGVSGNGPDTSLTVDAGENFYGTTFAGGVAGEGGCGEVFKLAVVPGKAMRAETELHRFNCADGRNPVAPLLLGPDGVLYGTTFYGGSNDLGVVFKLTPPPSGSTKWVETVLYSFTGRDGENPIGQLVLDKAGAIYGVTENGGTNLLGNVFKLTPPAKGKTKWTETEIFPFDYGTGNSPMAGLVMDSAGALYGTVSYNGDTSLGSGVAFKLTPPAKGKTAWSYTPLHVFGLNTNDGNTPESELIFDSSGALYGTTAGGGATTANGGHVGTVFKLTPPAKGSTSWTETVLYSFIGGADGSAPFVPLVMDKTGALYGTTSVGGSNEDGTIFKLTPPAKGKTKWGFSTVHNFGYSDGASPVAGLTLTPNGELVGTTSDGGKGFGTTFKFVP